MRDPLLSLGDPRVEARAVRLMQLTATIASGFLAANHRPTAQSFEAWVESALAIEASVIAKLEPGS